MNIKLVLLVFISLRVTDSANILCLYPTISISHYMFAEPLLVELSKRGHNITVFTEFSSIKETSANYHVVVLPSNSQLNEFIKMLMNNADDKLILLKNVLKLEIFLSTFLSVLKRPELDRIRAEAKIDLLITEAGLGDSFLALQKDFDCPSIQLSTVPPLNDFFHRMGNPIGISYIPNMLLSSSSEPLNFWSRTIHFVVSCTEDIIFGILLRQMARDFLPYLPSSDYPLSVSQTTRNVSLLLLNQHFSQGIVRPLLPGIIEVSGMHIKPPSPLSPHLQEFMDKSEHGVILFSFGTIVKSSDLSAEQIKVFLNSFSKLRANILWKFDDDTVAPLPPNVHIFKWIPQNDLLAHPKLKLFITHGGLGGISEARYHGVPLVLLPVFGDQLLNADQVISEGWGQSLNFDEINEPELDGAINEVLTNPKFRERAQYLSKLFHDRPMTPMQTAIFWVEYVIRHRGAYHLQSNAKKLNFMQLHSFDVIGALVGCLLLICFISYFFVKNTIRFCRTNYKNKLKEE